MATSQMAFDEPAIARPRVLLGEQTLSSILRNIVHVYRHHLGVILGCAVLPILPVLSLMLLFAEAAPAITALAALGFMAALLICPAALTVVLSDICIGNAPKLTRAFSHILGRVRLLFAATVFALEDRRNLDALRRSFALTKGQAWRLTGLTLAPILLACLAAIPAIIVVALVGSIPGMDTAFGQHIMVLGVYFVILGLVLPVAGTTAVLLYYDQRVRRESYDAQTLAEDLMR